MTLVNPHLFPVMWSAWGGYWLLLSRGNKPTVHQESMLSRIGHIGPLLLGLAMLASPAFSISWLGQRFVADDPAGYTIGATITALGLLLTVWARMHIGRNWSGTVTIKDHHELITSGPYAWVRHPIYTGLLFAFIGSALALGEWRGVLAALLALIALWRKLRLEERWMAREFGSNYTAYQRRVAALVPFLL